MSANSLDCRLLCASVCTYAVDQNGDFDPKQSQPYYDVAGYAAPPAAFVAGDDAINACLVGTVADAGSGPAVVLAFRGTLPVTDPPTFAEILDWFNDAEDAPMAAPGLPGRVHTGFWTALQSLWAPAVAEVRRQMSAGGGALPLHVTGHSKGGALASLAAAQCAFNEGLTPAGVSTFASPMTGDLDFATGYNALGFNAARYEYADDVVPHLPPTPFVADLLGWLPVVGPYFQQLAAYDYTPVGTLKFIDWDGHLVGDSFGLWWQRFKSLAELVAELQFEQIAADHSSRCGGGYMDVCPGVCEPQAAAAGRGATRASVAGWRAARARRKGARTFEGAEGARTCA